MSLLVIEDDPDQSELIREVLEDQFGAGSVTVASTRAQALATDVNRFDLILCDHNLPDCEGLDLLVEIRRRSQVPVMMLTGENVKEMAREAIRRGAVDYVVKTGDYLFTVPLVVEKNLAAAAVRSNEDSLRMDLELRNTQLQSSLRHVEELAATDALSGLYNRRHFFVLFNQMFADAYRTGADLSCVMIDLDRFKQLNDSRGHQVGDEVIKLAARSIQGNLRTMDAAGRYGGDEFVLLLPHADSTEAAGVADRIRRDYGQTSLKLLQTDTPMTMSIGVAHLHGGRFASAEALLERADQALYAAKEAGRNQIHAAA